ncbi:MAG: hypothetical protein IV298_16145, partial [Cylindrospermopsis raciborskii KL1]|nr:hypothetical protein [Cylindrospermopsis raciborskii KL1]
MNNYTEEECQSLTTSLNSVLPHISYSVIGKEVGASGTPHLQGYIRLKPSFLLAARGTISKWKSLFPGLQRAHLEPAYGSDQDSEKYCSKDGDLFFKHGTPDDSKSNVWSQIYNCKTMDEIHDIDPHFAVKNYFQALAITRSNSLGSTQPVPPKMLRPWQHQCLIRLMNQTPRQITFVVDEDGNSGKSVLAKFIAGNLPPKSVFYCRGGKQADIIHAFAKIAGTAKYLIFDYARNRQPDFYSWELFEEIKDGGITSLKYDSQCFWGSPAYKILVLGNHDLTDHRWRLTQDRWDVVRLHNAASEPFSVDPIKDTSPEFRAAYNIDAPPDLPTVTAEDVELDGVNLFDGLTSEDIESLDQIAQDLFPVDD